jgi:hypothetical protein
VAVASLIFACKCASKKKRKTGWRRQNWPGIKPGSLRVTGDPDRRIRCGRLVGFVLVRQTADPAADHLVLLRDLPDAMIYLGCVTDAGGRLREGPKSGFKTWMA